MINDAINFINVDAISKIHLESAFSDESWMNGNLNGSSLMKKANAKSQYYYAKNQQDSSSAISFNQSMMTNSAGIMRKNETPKNQKNSKMIQGINQV